MAIHYVDSAAAGANDGTSWTDAWTSILSADGAATAAGDTVLIDDGHSETGTIGTLTFASTPANPLRLLCVDKADDSRSSGAQVICTSGSMQVNGDIVGDGVTFSQEATATFVINNVPGDIQRWTNSTFKHSGASSAGITVNSSRCLTLFDGCTVDLTGITADTQTLIVGTTGSGFRMRGGEIKARSAGTQTSLMSGGGAGGATIILEGVLLTNAVTNLFVMSTGLRLEIRRCTLPSFTNFLSATPTENELGYFALLEACKTGTLSAPELGLTWLENRVGAVKSSLARYRTGGADDGEQANAHSWEMVSNANALEQVSWLESPPITRWVDASDSQTVTLYVASGVTLQDDEFWIEVLSPNETAGPSTTAQGRYQSTRLAFRGTPADLTSDSSTWNGMDTDVKQKIDVTISPAVAGPVVVRACLAKANTTVYIDPQLILS